MNPEKIENIIVKYFSKSASIKELEALSKWLEKDTNKQFFRNYVKLNYYIDFNLKDFDITQEKKKILQRTSVKRLRVFTTISKYAALILLFVAVGYFIRINNQVVNNTPTSTKVVNNTIPIGTDKATLTLADGSQIALEKGEDYVSNNLTSNGEEIVYESSSKKTDLIYNYLTIPRGGQYSITLSDGTKVWLNSESKIKYPVNFIEGLPRKVELVYGEAYFDVSPAKSPNSEFKVFTQGQEISVLGTEFNLKSYQDEDVIQTTLVEGKVAVEIDKISDNLTPGEQFTLNVFSRKTDKKVVDVNKVISWKNGEFSFQYKTLSEICKLMKRWYDVDIYITNPEIEHVIFTGSMSRNQDIENILKTFYNLKNIQYEIKSNKEIYLK